MDIKLVQGAKNQLKNQLPRTLLHWLFTGRAFSIAFNIYFNFCPCTGTIAEGAPVIPISAQLKYNIDVVCEYVTKKIPVPVRDFTSEPRLIGEYNISSCKFLTLLTSPVLVQASLASY